MSLFDIAAAKSEIYRDAHAKHANGANPRKKEPTISTISTNSTGTLRNLKKSEPDVDSLSDAADTEQEGRDQEAVEEAKAERAAIAEIDGGLTRTHAGYLAEQAAAYYAHHWSCPICRRNTDAGSGTHRPCAGGAELWRRYEGAAQRGSRA